MGKKVFCKNYLQSNLGYLNWLGPGKNIQINEVMIFMIYNIIMTDCITTHLVALANKGTLLCAAVSVLSLFACGVLL